MAKIYLDLEESLLVRSKEELNEIREELVGNCAELLCMANEDNVDAFSQIGSNIMLVSDILKEMTESEEIK